ncbi:MAG TPA: helix-turn-helix transcriptional regulator [Rhizomicrobium sp.]|jgi:y4mF family transcriptional regulator|nr:helix-turn-helix transcriptional regulator [Rhizomicrobium sp.]
MFPIGKMAMTPAEIGNFVRETRRAAGLTQGQLAGAAGVGQRFLIELEAGKSTAQLGKTLAVLAVLGCRVTIDGPPPARKRR